MIEIDICPCAAGSSGLRLDGQPRAGRVHAKEKA
jgi:hypothetical protein